MFCHPASVGEVVVGSLTSVDIIASAEDWLTKCENCYVPLPALAGERSSFYHQLGQIET
jgi:hypothetical protein